MPQLYIDGSGSAPHDAQRFPGQRKTPATEETIATNLRSAPRPADVGQGRQAARKPFDLLRVPTREERLIC